MTTLKRIFALFAAVCILAAGLCSCNKETVSEVPEGMKEASGENVDYNFYIPEHWTADVDNGATTAYYSESDRSNVSVMTFSANYTDDTLASWWQSFESDFQNVYTDFEVISTENVVLDGIPALKTVFKGTLEDYEYQFMQIAAVKGQALSRPQIYVFTYTSVPDAYESHLEDVQSMIDAFDFHGTEEADSTEG